MDSLQMLEDACARCNEFPRTSLRTKTREHTLNVLHKRLHEKRGDLFCQDGSASVRFLELARMDEGYHETRVYNNGELQTHLNRATTQHRADPRQRFFFVEAPNSRARLNVTFEMFMYTSTYLQITPAFLELVFPFGLQHYAQGFHFSNFAAENRWCERDKGLEIPQLRRSGQHTEICYNLKSVEQTRDPNNPWSIRQCSVFHRYDVDSEHAVWVIIKGNTLIQHLVKRHNEEQLNVRTQAVGEDHSALASSLSIHELLCVWAGEGWHWYINDLEQKLQDLTRGALTIPVQTEKFFDRPSAAEKTTGMLPTLSRKTTKRKWSMRSGSFSMGKVMSWSTSTTQPAMEVDDEKLKQCMDAVMPPRPTTIPTSFSIRDLQSVQAIQEKADEVLLILKSNRNIMSSICTNYKAMAKTASLVDKLGVYAERDINDLHHAVSDIMEKCSLQQTRVEMLLHLVAERKSILHAILQHHNMEANNQLAQRARVSAEKMEDMTREMHEIAVKTKVETVSMRIITLVTLFFLPGTFISTLMSTPIVNFSPGNTSFTAHNIGVGALEFFLIISVPLVLFTFAAWYGVYWWEKRKERRPVKLGPDVV